MKKCYLIVLFYLFIVSSNFAQWENAIIHPNTNSLRSLNFVDENNGYAVGMDGIIVKTTNKGHSWIINTIKKKVNFIDVTTTSPNFAWACGDSGTVYKTTDGGNSWNNNSVSSTEQLNTIQFIDNNLGFVAGSNGIICKTTDGGNNWHADTLQGMAYINKLFFLNANIGWAVGNGISWANGWIWKTIDGGNSWVKIDSVVGQLYSVQFINENIGYFVGSAVYKTNDGGYSVGVVNNINWGCYDLHFVSSELGWVVGYDGLTMKTTDGGSTWESQAPNPGGGNALWSVNFPSANYGYLCGNSDIIWQTSDGGASWIKQRVAMPSNLQGVFATDSNHCWAVGSLKTLFTTNGGKNWEITVPNDIPHNMTPSLTSAFFINNSIGWLCGANGFIFKTTNGGVDWILQAEYPNRYLRHIYFLDENKGWACGATNNFNDELLYTTNGGATWLEKDLGTTDDFSCIYFINENLGWLSSNAHLYKTTDGGSNWQVVSSANFTSTKSIYFVDENTGWASGNNVYSTTDGGSNWVSQTSTLGAPFETVRFFNAQKGWYGGFGGIFGTVDGGNNWSKQFDSHIYDLTFIDENYGWAVGLGDGFYGVNTVGIYKTSNGGFSDVADETPILSNFNLLQNYPNPFNPSTTISFNLLNTEFTTLKIYDILGREITTLINEELNAGKHTKMFNANDLSSGVYFYKLQSGKFSETKKMMLVR